jgi:hypothetical protein
LSTCGLASLSVPNRDAP